MSTCPVGFIYLTQAVWLVAGVLIGVVVPRLWKRR
jgi:uncharacterized membrane-anchored protein YhcB (DUF1043 family)